MSSSFALGRLQAARRACAVQVCPPDLESTWKEPWIAAARPVDGLSDGSILTRWCDFFDDDFFASHFWTMWRTTFAFQNWHSAIELKRYFLRFMQEFDRIDTLAGVRRSVFNQYDP